MTESAHEGDAAVLLIPMVPADEEAFYEMALEHHRSLNPAFRPRSEWRAHYFRSILDDEQIHARWLISGGVRVGFAIYLLEKHRFVPRMDGVIREVFVVPSFRGRQLAFRSGTSMVEEMKALGAERIYVDMVANDERASALWRKVGFRPHTERYVHAVDE